MSVSRSDWHSPSGASTRWPLSPASVGPAPRTVSCCGSADNGFDALITVDAGLYVEPDVPLRVLVLRAGSNRLQALLPLMPSVLEQLAALPPGRTEIIAAKPSA